MVIESIKSKRFDSIVLETLKAWQRQARSLGKNAGLKEQFIYLKNCFSHVLGPEAQLQAVNKSQLEQLITKMNEHQWLVTTDVELGAKYNRHSDGKDSMIICAKQFDTCFDSQGQLIKAISLYIRGAQQLIIDCAFEQELLLYKTTDYKSKVKYHGEYIIHPNNDGSFLPEFPSANDEK